MMDEIDHRLTVGDECFGTGWVICFDCHKDGTTLKVENYDGFSQDALTHAQISNLLGIAQTHLQHNMGHDVKVFEFRRGE